uniref:SMODS and SLOG-associating 2TM effector domain-containing protein n=1 Tax=Candidatus Kentrum sp. LPFa TaxID=2126335 RepID=A0A450VNF0_9GAMM|nr:MAG: hypothetical protein BECKLPF1236A_GA0070988_100023 [Candidatus Kentron sp. LPFa]VFK25430.1 MAG: hypothetical protein BECKLPF1236C_GA0070990_1002122 [Candidatus Kentron sp. LPFa]
MGSEETTTSAQPETGATRQTASFPLSGSERDGSRCPVQRNDRNLAPNTAAATTKEEVSNLIFDCERLSIYHAIRRDFLDKWQRISNFLVVLSGTAAFAALSAKWSMDWLALVPALFGLASLVFDFSGKARIHENVYRRLCALRGSILADENAERKIGKWQEAIHEIYADEASVYRALDAWAHNLACDGRGEKEYKLKIPWIHLLLKNVWPFWSANYASKTGM